ncbi:MAG: PIG-L family deacetylase, partial [Sphingobacteriia bacterium]|nr:PIG-L family deacetylase [Sphingobacteriia bacterium]
FFQLEEKHVLLKIAATKCYESQKGRDYLDEGYLRGIVRSHGVQIGVPFAEVFETDRYIFR